MFEPHRSRPGSPPSRANLEPAMRFFLLSLKSRQRSRRATFSDRARCLTIACRRKTPSLTAPRPLPRCQYPILRKADSISATRWFPHSKSGTAHLALRSVSQQRPLFGKNHKTKLLCGIVSRSHKFDNYMPASGFNNRFIGKEFCGKMVAPDGLFSVKRFHGLCHPGPGRKRTQ
jgi:hypothetical protein